MEKKSEKAIGNETERKRREEEEEEREDEGTTMTVGETCRSFAMDEERDRGRRRREIGSGWDVLAQMQGPYYGISKLFFFS